VERVDPNEALEWLRGAAPDAGAGETAGFDLSGWEASAWVLHTMFERPGADSHLSYQDVHQLGLRSGSLDPLMIGEVNFDDKAVVTGIPLGRTADPGPGWARLRWSDFGGRVNAPMATCGYPPCFKWFPGPSWPANIRPPAEGSLDRGALLALLEVLAAHSKSGLSTRTTCFFVAMATRHWKGPLVFSGPLAEVATLYDDEGVVASPSNFWPIDGSWFVLTDWDLLGTKVSGPPRLIDDLHAHPELEVVDFPWQR
jgi:hypothetical protein